MSTASLVPSQVLGWHDTPAPVVTVEFVVVMCVSTTPFDNDYDVRLYGQLSVVARSPVAVYNDSRLALLFAFV